MQSDVRLKQSALLLDLLALCVAIGFVIGGLMVRDRLPIIPLADGDTWGYLYPEPSWLSSLGFQQDCGRDGLHPALLAGILDVSGDFLRHYSRPAIFRTGRPFGFLADLSIMVSAAAGAKATSEGLRRETTSWCERGMAYVPVESLRLSRTMK